MGHTLHDYMLLKMVFPSFVAQSAMASNFVQYVISQIYIQFTP